MNCRRLFLSATLLLLVQLLAGQPVTESKTLKRSFAAGSEPVVEITNKYGNIYVSSSRNDSVTIVVEITATSSGGERISSQVSDVTVEPRQVGDIVRAETIFRKGFTSWLEGIRSLTRGFISYDARLQIDYHVECPEGTALRLTNSYGDIYIGIGTPQLILKLTNGNLDAAAVGNAQLLELTFGKANIRSINEGKLTLSFSELRMREADRLKLASTASKVWIDRCGSADLNSRRDDISFGEAGRLTGISYFSNITADQLTDEANMTIKYGSLELEAVSRQFSAVELSSSYAELLLTFEERAGYSLEIKHSAATVSISGIRPEPAVTEISAEARQYLTEGKSGSGRSRVRLDMNRGSVRLVQKQ